MIRAAAMFSAMTLTLVLVPGDVRGQEVPSTPRATAADTIDLTTPEGRRALLRRRPFEPQAVPVFTGERTLFYGSRPTQVQEGSQVLLVPPSQVPTLSPALFQAAGWLLEPGEALASLGRIESFSGGQDVRLGRTTVLPYDDVRVVLEGTGPVSPGDRFLAVRLGRQVEHVGRVVVPTGILEVQRADGSGAVVRLVRDLSKVELGHEIVPLRTFPLSPGVYPSDTPSGFTAQVLTFEEHKELYLPGDRFFIDAGAADGLEIGDEFRAYAGAGDGWEGADAGDFQVVGLRDGTATLRILQSRLPGVIRPGMIVVLTRAMP